MTFWAVVGLVVTIIPVVFLTILLVGGLLTFSERRYNPVEEVIAWWVILLVWVALLSLAIWQPLHWAGLA